MKNPTISLKRSLDVTIKDILKRLNELDGSDKKALNDEYREWFQASEGCKDQPHVLYAKQINIEQL
tara:strand:+ start:324 stop:521 length:198 start_codon:yes stop_codon:yes gene_type:complete